MTINLNEASVELTCPKCRHKFKQTAGRLKNDPDIPCPDCGAVIHIKAEGLRKGIESAGKSLDALKRKLRDLK